MEVRIKKDIRSFSVKRQKFLNGVIYSVDDTMGKYLLSTGYFERVPGTTKVEKKEGTKKSSGKK